MSISANITSKDDWIIVRYLESVPFEYVAQFSSGILKNWHFPQCSVPLLIQS